MPKVPHLGPWPPCSVTRGPFGLNDRGFTGRLASWPQRGPPVILTVHRRREGSAGGTWGWEPPGAAAEPAAGRAAGRVAGAAAGGAGDLGTDARAAGGGLRGRLRTCPRDPS